MARKIATTTLVDRAHLDEFLRPRHRAVLITRRADGGVQASPVPCSFRFRLRFSVMVMSDEFDGPWVQVDGTAEVTDVPDAVEGLVEYFRCISGEHPDWDEYRAAMIAQGKPLIAVTPQRWGPIATGGFPPELA